MSLRAQMEVVLDGLASIKETVRRKDPHLYERWKAGGFLVNDDIVSMYPSIEDVVQEMESKEESEDEDKPTEE